MREAFGVRAYSAAFLCPPVSVGTKKQRNTRALQTLRAFRLPLCRFASFSSAVKLCGLLAPCPSHSQPVHNRYTPFAL